MVDFVDEVNEALKREQLENIWKRYGAYVLALCVGIVIATAASVLWKNHQESVRQEQTAEYLAAQEKSEAKNWADAVAMYGDVARGRSGGMAGIAGLQQARALKEMGKLPEAERAFLDVANNTSDMSVRSIARIAAAQVMMREKKAYTDVNATLQPIMNDPQNPYLAFAKEQLAYAAYAANDVETAKRLLSELASDEGTPEAMRARADAFVSTLGGVVPKMSAEIPASAKEK